MPNKSSKFTRVNDKSNNNQCSLCISADFLRWKRRPVSRIHAVNFQESETEKSKSNIGIEIRSSCASDPLPMESANSNPNPFYAHNSFKLLDPLQTSTRATRPITNVDKNQRQSLMALHKFQHSYTRRRSDRSNTCLTFWGTRGQRMFCRMLDSTSAFIIRYSNF